jgi:hypothetical protein
VLFEPMSPLTISNISRMGGPPKGELTVQVDAVAVGSHARHTRFSTSLPRTLVCFS